MRFFFADKCSICRKCYEELKPVFIRYKTLGYSSLSLYYYDEKVQSLLYQFKGTFDYELKDVFIDYCLPLIKLYYIGYVIVPAPSSEEAILQRGFSQVIEMFKTLKMPICECFRKNKMHFQHEASAKDRAKVSEVIEYIEGVKIKGKRILLVDDVYTTGSTLKACIRLLEKQHPKKIKILTMAKTRDIIDRK